MTPLSRTLSSESSTISERIQRTTAFAAPPVPPPRPPSPPTRPSIALSEASAGAAQAQAWAQQQQRQQSQSQPQPLQQNRRRLLFGWPRRATAASNEIKADAAKATGARVLAAEAAEAPRENASHSHGQNVTLHRSPPRPAVLPNEFPSRGPNGEALAVLSARQYLAVVTSEGKVRLMRTGFDPSLTAHIVCAPSSPK